MKKNRIKIITLSVRLRRRFVSLRTRVRKWFEKQRQKHEQDRLVRLIRKRYIQTGDSTIMIKYYELAYDVETYLHNLQLANVLTYELQERNYIIHIKENEYDI